MKESSIAAVSATIKRQSREIWLDIFKENIQIQMSTNTNTSYDSTDFMDCDIITQQSHEIAAKKENPRFNFILRLPCRIVVIQVFSFYGSEASIKKLLRQLSKSTRQYICNYRLSLP